MEWEQYVQSVLAEERCLDNISILLDGTEILLPSIVKASVFMLEKMIQNQGRNNLFVFPDGEQLPFLFMMAKLIFNIYNGKIENQYLPEEFDRGQILKLGNCVVEFLGVGEEPLLEGKKAIYLKFADCDKFYCPIEAAPYFQKSDTKKKLSKVGAYRKEKRKIDEAERKNDNCLQNLKEMKTHVKKTIFYVATVSNSQNFARKMLIDGIPFFEYFLVSLTNCFGEMENIKGRYIGTPALSFTRQIEYVNEAINNGAKAQSVIINLVECDVECQLAALDDLLQYKIPVLCITSTANSFDLKSLEDRKFNIWRWDEDSIAESLRSDADIIFAKRIEKCLKSKIFYHSLSAPEISDSFNILYHYNRFIGNESANLNSIFRKLLRISYSMLRNVKEMGDGEKRQFLEEVEFCKTRLEEEKNFVNEDVYRDLENVITNTEEIVNKMNSYPKTEAIYQFLMDSRIDSFYLICANNDSVSDVKEYWSERLAKSGYRPNIMVVYAKDFLKLGKYNSRIAVIVGWLNAFILRKIIYGYLVEEIHIYTYECEERWKSVHTKSWRIGLNNQNNRKIAEKSFANQIVHVYGERVPIMTSAEQTVLCEKDDFDLIIQENRYRQYMSRGGQTHENVVNARPVGFAGGEFALYTRGHKILTASKIIAQIDNKIEKKEVEELTVGDFIVIRESSKDIIREVADNILSANNKSNFRELVTLWKKVLKGKLAFSSLEEIYRILCDLGCTKSIQTVRNWLTDEDIIIPQDKEDLIFIAQMTNDTELLDKIDEIFKAGTFIKNAHIKAGRIVSERLTRGIAEGLLLEERIDIYNIWDPIEIILEEVGPVKIFKVIDLGQEWMPISANDANKILAEEKENIYGKNDTINYFA